MHRRNAVQLRVAFSAAAICAVLAAAILSGSHRAGLLAIGTVREADPIAVRSSSTTIDPSVDKAGASHDRLPSPL
jgi:hypothetical protein